MESQRTNGHTVSKLATHIVWSTKYRYTVLTGDIKVRCRTLFIQICEAEGFFNIPHNGLVMKM